MIGFNKPYLTGKELDYISEAASNKQLAGDGYFTKQCSSWLEEKVGCNKALLTHSCTAALEMAAILSNIKAGDEIIMPSYTFVSTANAFVLRGGIPVFVDIREDTLNINEKLIEAAITDRTKAIVVMHYAGVACEMDTIMEIAKSYNLLVIEDAAQGIMSKYKGKPLGSIGDIGCFSFHETKNIISGEGGALLLNNEEFINRAEILREKGTNRSQFFRGEIDKYTWLDIGSSFLPGELTAAFLWAQLEEADSIINERKKVWDYYHEALHEIENKGRIRRPFIPEGVEGNGHIYYLLMKDLKDRNNFIKNMKKHGVDCVFHYIPLHNSPSGLKYGKYSGTLEITEEIANKIVRLPLWLGVDSRKVYDCINKTL